MVTNAKVTVDDVKKTAASAATTVKSAVASAPATTKKVVAEVKKEVEKKAPAKAAAKKTTAKKATTKKATTKKVATKKKEVATTAVVQYQDREFTEAECLKKAQAQFKKDYKGKTLEEISIYIKPEERRIYYVANKDSVGSVEL